MSEMLRVALFAADESACGWYRMRQPAEVAARDGEIEVSFHDRIPYRRNALTGEITDAKVDADVVVLQRPLDRTVVETITHLQRHGTAVVVELDDDLANLHMQHSLFAELHPTRSPNLNSRHLTRACRLADLVTVTTPALARRYGTGNTRVLPNCVPESLLDIRAEHDGRTIGWGGSTESHPGDLTVTRGGVDQALARTAARFLTVGPPDRVRTQLHLSEEPDSTDGLPFGEYHQALAQLDVGIAPLLDNAFNRAKSGLKALEYAALGIPFVASPLPEYARLAAEGIGTLASDRSRDWCRSITKLLTDTAFREESIIRSRQLVAERHTYERNAWEWSEAWRDALNIRHRSSIPVSA